MPELDISHEFPLKNDLIYLNHAAVSPLPQRTTNALIQFAQENTRQGSLNYYEWMETEKDLKNKIVQLINAPAIDDIALLKNTSEALSVVAYGLDWHKGDNVVSSNQEFPSNRIVWESLANKGVTLRMADYSDNSPEDNIIKLCDRHTRLVAVSSIQYASGYRTDLHKIGEFCRKNDILFCVDAIQSVGAVQFDVQSIGADFAMADGHKWMLGPEGLAFFYSHPNARDKLKLSQFGWHMTEDYLNFDAKNWQVASSSRKFECGSPNMLGIHALNASLSLLLDYGMDNVENALLNNVEYFMDYIVQSKHYNLLTLARPKHYGGIVTFEHAHMANSDFFSELSKQGILCAPRGGGIRFSPHFYTSSEVLGKTIDILQSLAKK